MFLLQTQLQQISVQEHLLVKTALVPLTFISCASPPPTFKPNGPAISKYPHKFDVTKGQHAFFMKYLV